MATFKSMRFAAGFAMLVGGASAAVAQDYRGHINTQLDLIKLVAARDGYRESHDRTIELVNGGQRPSHSITLRSGSDYIIAAVCDQDCNDVDLEVFDENGRSIGSDADSSDIAMVRISPRWTGSFSVRPHLYQCRIGTCFYGIGVFRK